MARYIDSFKNDPKAKVVIEGKEVWVISKAVIAPLIWRIRDAWGVVTGKYEAVKFYE
jgi:hypothetical protein